MIFCFRLLACAVIATASQLNAASAVDTIEITVRAFIPNKLIEDPDYIFNIAGPDGKQITVLKSPSPLDSDICYVTDQRDFSTDLAVTSRLWSRATISLAGNPSLSQPEGDTGLTHAVRCSTGAQYCTDKANKDNLKWGALSVSGSIVSLSLDAAASNPCIVPDVVVPAIKYAGTFKLDMNTGKLSFQGSVSKFPSIEAFAKYNQDKPVVIFNEPATGTVMSIGQIRSVSKDVVLPIFDGRWKSSDPTGRFTLEVKGDSYRFVERSSTGATLERQGKMQVGPDGRQIIYRANDAEVLKFLDFSPTIIASIQALGPKPSYLTFRRSGQSLEATWAGLLVTKDDKGKFKEMKQPGQGPVKDYGFAK